MKLHLMVEGARHSVELTEEGFTVGRGEAANLRLSANAVSRVHARFLLKDGRPHVMDLRSLNGTTAFCSQNPRYLPYWQGRGFGPEPVLKVARKKRHHR